MSELILWSEMAEAHWRTHMDEDDPNDGRPPGYMEVHTSTATICIGGGTEAIVTFTDVGATRMFMVGVGPAFDARDSTRGPHHSSEVYVYEFYGRALREARAACGWEWDPHPDKEEREGYVTEFSPIVGRTVTRDNHPSLTNGERDK